MIFLKNYFVDTTDDVDVISVIHEINRAIREANVPAGVATIVVAEPGGAITVLEPLPELVAQFKEALEVFPGEGVETLSRRKEPIPVAPRIKAAMLGKTIQIPFDNQRLILGPREEVVIVDFEKTGKRREFVVQVLGEAPAAGGPPKGPAPRGPRPPAPPKK
ncbi:MAG: YjbQ family protein [Pseudomonadota bacterium]